MSSTLDELSEINRTLRTVQTSGQARVAVGTALKALSAAYELLPKIPTEFGVPLLAESYKNSLNIARANLEDFYRQIQGQGNEDFRATWALHRWKVEKAYNEIAGVEGAANYVPRTSNWEILRDAIKGAPAVFGEAVGDIIEKAAETAAKVGSGLAKGLGAWGWGAVILVIVVVVFAMGGRQAVLSKIGGGA